MSAGLNTLVIAAGRESVTLTDPVAISGMYRARQIAEALPEGELYQIRSVDHDIREVAAGSQTPTGFFKQGEGKIGYGVVLPFGTGPKVFGMSLWHSVKPSFVNLPGGLAPLPPAPVANARHGVSQIPA